MEFFNTLHGAFFGGSVGLYALGTAFVLVVLGYNGAPLLLWSLAIGAALVGFGAPEGLLIGFLVVALVFNLKPIRRLLVSNQVMKLMTALGFIPKISETEKTALEAGVVWVEAELFSGRPNFKKILAEPYPELTTEEKAFLDGPVNKLLGMIDEFESWKLHDIKKDAWDFIKKERFLGMIIPKEYGGLGFSALAHAEVIAKLASRSAGATISVMVPNSLGPAELLMHYGTQKQKDYYLPRLAKGDEIPCFALTEPTAGSDAGSMKATGDLFKDSDGQLKIRLNWNKRYITLASISTILGMAFRLRDPNNLLGKGEDVGITCALIPSNSDGVVVGRRHDPMGVPFHNCPTQGKDVVISVDQVVGGEGGLGKGWGMLMESLAAGRGISLPAQSAGGAKLASRIVGAYAAIRKQFGVAIGKFEGIEEPLGRIGGKTYLLESFRMFTLGALDKGIKPPVITAMAKYNSTELVREIVVDGMDVMGGAAISRGPRNLISNAYLAAPIAITVEGANIMTRTLIIFGQGALRSHPFAFKEVDAVEKGDGKMFDEAFWGHIGHVVRNSFRAVVLSLTRGYVFLSPVGGPVARYYRRMAWTSATFAIMSDIAMASLGGALKMREKITGRYADILSWMFIGTSVLRRWEAEGRRKEDLPFVHYAMAHSFNKIQESFDGIFANLPVPGLTWLFRSVIKSWSSLNSIGFDIDDRLSHKISVVLQTDGEQRDRLTNGIYAPNDPQDAVGRLDNAFRLVKKAEGVEKKLRKAVRAKKIPRLKGPKLIEEGLKAGVITKEEHALIMGAEEARSDAIQVDDYSEEELTGKKAPGATEVPPEKLRINA